MSAQKHNHHATWTKSFEERATLPQTSPLTAYLLRLMAYKKTNLCVSADVSSASELILLAEEVGDSICLLKTHADTIMDFNERTVRRLRDLARRKRFLVFEDRKFGDIGSTVQKQYTSGPHRIAAWAEIVNAHIFPGPSIIQALRDAAESTIAIYNLTVHTEISGGSPISSRSPSPPASPAPPPLQPERQVISAPASARPSSAAVESDEGAPSGFDALMLDAPARPADRKLSVVSVHTRISTRTEPISPQPTPGLFPMDSKYGILGAPLHSSDAIEDEAENDDRGRHPPPFLRGLLLLAEMSSEGNLLTGAYTTRCVEMAREHREFVTGFISQRSLNEEPADNFLSMTPGVSLPPAGQTDMEALKGDGLGQRYREPRTVVLDDGCDVVIVGRGILQARYWATEAERYRTEAWKAYEERIGQTS